MFSGCEVILAERRAARSPEWDASMNIGAA
jgi:hypothetical protein